MIMFICTSGIVIIYEMISLYILVPIPVKDFIENIMLKPDQSDKQAIYLQKQI